MYHIAALHLVSPEHEGCVHGYISDRSRPVTDTSLHCLRNHGQQNTLRHKHLFLKECQQNTSQSYHLQVVELIELFQLYLNCCP